ncbi:MAG: lamin tail domain-containing protein [Clostridium sp.]|nr:lamin tail domain-containing protein [Prevotella sp.]MCM1429742.1 lamin tail domain-containing protein [Clostridium sp.]MCM1476215.1 lamin tail domain-containing protein [Muribaculaceae bacterium]
MNNFLQIMAVCALCATAMNVQAEKTLVFEETFANCKSSTIQGGYFTESLYFESDTMGDNAGWYTQNCYMSERAIKFSAKTKHGRAVSPAIRLVGDKGDITVYFRAQTWKGDDLVINVEVEGLEGSRQTIDLAGSPQVSDRNTPKSSVTITDVPSGSKLIFTGTGKEGGTGVTRFFLSDIQVFQEVPNESVANCVEMSTSYHHFDDIMAGNESEKRVVNVVSYGPQAQEASVSLPEGSSFKVTRMDLDCTDPTVEFVFEFDPVNAGYKEEIATVKMGDITRNIILTGYAKVYRPEKCEGKDATSDGFTITWPRVKGMDKLDLKVWSVEERQLVAPDLMFSKYIEGSSNNRAVEVFNGTGHAVSLKGYYLMMESNGAGGLTACKFEFPDVTLENGDSYTVANANFGAVRDIANKTIGFSDGGYANIMTFTGDDAIGLFNAENVLVDILGYESTDVNDRVSGDWGMDVTYYRRAESYMPTPKFYVEDWIKYPKDYCDSFGSHEMDSFGDFRNIVKDIEISDPSTTEMHIDGLEGGKTYYFALRGHSNGQQTHYSPVALISTLGNSGIESIEATDSVNAEYYDLNGLRLNGAPTVPGIYVKKVGGNTFKVVLR